MQLRGLIAFIEKQYILSARGRNVHIIWVYAYIAKEDK